MNNAVDSSQHPNPECQKAPKRFSWPIALSSAALLVSGAALAVSMQLAGNAQVPVHWMNHAQLAGSDMENRSILLADRTSTPRDRGLFSGSSQIIADVAEAIAPSVVNIDIKRTAGRPPVMSPFDDEFFQRFFGLPQMPFRQFPQRTPMIRGNGSGVIISHEGHILTNNHVVNGAEEITVTLNDGRKLSAKVIGRDAFSDLAVLKLDGATNLRPAMLGASSRLRPGEWVIAVGSPLGFDHTVTLGIVSALSRQVPDINANVEFIQTDAAINPGNSGGPLVNLNGEVIGINTAIAGTGQNIGFAIPVDTAKKVVQDLLANGKVTRPWIGITMTEMSPELARSLGVADNMKGVIVAQVSPNSPSFRAGFQQGDIIQRIEGQVITKPKEIQELVRSKPVNTPLNFQVLRNGQMVALTLRTEILPDTVANPLQQDWQDQ